MRVLIACEYTGTERDAFITAGHDAMSCDLLPTETSGPHYRGDVRDLLTERKAMHDAQGLAWHQVALAANAPMLTKATLVDGDVEVGILPTGQVVGVIDELPTVDDLVRRIVAEATRRGVFADQSAAEFAPLPPLTAHTESG